MRPRVTVVVAGLQEVVKQNYNVEVVQQKTNNAPEYFNEVLDTIDSDIYCFLSHRDNFTDEFSIDKAIERMFIHPIIGTIYADCLVNKDGYLSTVYYPAFHPNLLGSSIIINSPLIVKKPQQPIRFNTSLNFLYFHEYLSRIGRKQFPLHIAYPLFTCVEDLSIDIQTELKKLENV